MNTIHPVRFQPYAFFEPLPGRQAGAQAYQVCKRDDNTAVRVQSYRHSTVLDLFFAGLLSCVIKIIFIVMELTVDGAFAKNPTVIYEKLSSANDLFWPTKCPGTKKKVPMPAQAGGFAQQRKPNVRQGRVVPPQLYGNTAGTGIYISSSLVPMVQSLLKEPLARRLFKIAKKNGLVSITEEPGLLRENIPVEADAVCNLLSGEYRIRLSDAGNKYNMVSLVHELVHAANPNNSNSQTEEWFAENIGRRVYARQTGDQSLRMLAFTSIENMYAHLPMGSDFKTTLAMLLSRQ